MLNFTDKELENLSNPDNHSIKYDGFEFVWYADKGDGMQVHSLVRSSDPVKIAANVHYWVAKYRKELRLRQSKNDKQSFVKLALNQKELFDIAHSEDKTALKIQLMLRIDPLLTPTTLINEYGLPRKSVYRFFE